MTHKKWARGFKPAAAYPCLNQIRTVQKKAGQNLDKL